jgi:hypothetical protein
MLMLVVAYKINDSLVGNYEREQGGCSAVLLIIFTAIITIGNIVWLSF